MAKFHGVILLFNTAIDFIQAYPTFDMNEVFGATTASEKMGCTPALNQIYRRIDFVAGASLCASCLAGTYSVSDGMNLLSCSV